MRMGVCAETNREKNSSQSKAGNREEEIKLPKKYEREVTAGESKEGMRKQVKK